LFAAAVLREKNLTQPLMRLYPNFYAGYKIGTDMCPVRIFSDDNDEKTGARTLAVARLSVSVGLTLWIMQAP
jgi:hypothetical protein